VATTKPKQIPKNQESRLTNNHSTPNGEKSLKTAIASLPWLQDLDEDQVNALTRISRSKNVGAGEYLFHQGDKEDYLYILLDGRVAIEVDVPGRESLVLYQAEPIDLIGWSSVTPVIRERTASARSLLPSKLIALDSVKLRQLCDEDHHLGYTIMRRLAHVIATRLLITRMELTELLSGIPDQVDNPSSA